MVAVIVALSVISAIAQDVNDKRDAKTSREKSGVLLLAHGGKQNWDDEVIKLAAVVNQTTPVEVAFGMASKRSIQQAVDKLADRGVSEIIAVPLFVSSHSSVITSTEYLLGLRKPAPPELAIFAKMAHGHGAHNSHQEAEKSFDPATPVKSRIPIRMLTALNGHPLVADILLSRALSISQGAEKEVVIVVAHHDVEHHTAK